MSRGTRAYSVILGLPGCFWNRVTQFYITQFQNGLLSFTFTKKKYMNQVIT